MERLRFTPAGLEKQDSDLLYFRLTGEDEFWHLG